MAPGANVRPLTIRSANSCKQEGQPFRLPQPHPVDALTSPNQADIGCSLQSCGYSPSRSSQSSPCHVRCSFLTECRKRHLGDMGSENATSQMRTYTGWSALAVPSFSSSAYSSASSPSE